MAAMARTWAWEGFHCDLGHPHFPTAPCNEETYLPPQSWLQPPTAACSALEVAAPDEIANG